MADLECRTRSAPDWHRWKILKVPGEGGIAPPKIRQVPKPQALLFRSLLCVALCFLCLKQPGSLSESCWLKPESCCSGGPIGKNRWPVGLSQLARTDYFFYRICSSCDFRDSLMSPNNSQELQEGGNWHVCQSPIWKPQNPRKNPNGIGEPFFYWMA